MQEDRDRGKKKSGQDKTQLAKWSVGNFKSAKDKFLKKKLKKKSGIKRSKKYMDKDTDLIINKI
jgi:hypothetical protein